ncbi:MAG: RecB family exonuclease [Microthrixaceae bacterium]
MGLPEPPEAPEALPLGDDLATHGGLPLPSSLSPSKVSTFKDCALAFRFSAIDRLPEPPSEPAMRGTAVHRALELLLGDAPQARTPELATTHLATALEEMHDSDEWEELDLDDTGSQAFDKECATIMERYFAVEDPRSVEPVGLELMLESEIGGVKVRGIIDRLERAADGSLVVTDYKTGRTPMPAQEQSRLGGVHFYAFLCKEHFGEIPSSIQLMYLGSEPQIISTTPTEQSVRGLRNRVAAIWQAVERACENDDFRPKPSALCNWCAFQQYCPAFGGDPAEARALSLQLHSEAT